MSKSVGELVAKLVLDIQEFEKKADKSKAVAKRLEKEIDEIQDRINTKLTGIGTKLSAGVTLPLTLLSKQALTTFTGFEQSMQNTFSVMGATAEEMEALRQKAEQMGASTRFRASQAADALYSLGSAGQSAGQSIKSLDGVLKLAGATGSDLAFTSETVTSTLSQFELEADKAAHIADVYAMAISKSQANMTKLSYSMKYAGAISNNLNIRLETTTAALMRLYNTGFGGEQAGTILRAILQKLAGGTEDFKNKLAAVGIEYDEVNPKTTNLADILERLKEANIGVTETTELFGEVAAAGMQKLIDGGGEAIRTMDEMLQSSDGAAKKMQEIQNASFANTQAELSSAFEAVQITLTSNVIPAVEIFAKGITGVLKVINDLPVGLQITGQGFAAIAASAGPLLLVAISIKKIKREMAQLNVALMHNPIFLWGAAIAAAGTVAMGVIAQIRKAQDDEVKRAGRRLKELNKMKDEALTQKTKMSRAKELLKEYDELKSKTSLTADQQARYNAVLKELEQIVPSAVVVLDKNGKALLKNQKDVEEAIKGNELLSKLFLEANAEAAKVEIDIAKKREQTLKSQEKEQEEALGRATARFGNLNTLYAKLFKLDQERKKILAERGKTPLKDYSTDLTQIYKEAKKVIENNNVQGIFFSEAASKNLSLTLEQIDRERKRALNYTTKLKEGITKLQDEAADLKEKQAELSKLLKDDEDKKDKTPETKKTNEEIKKEKLQELKKSWKEFQNEKIHREREEARANGERFDENKAKFEFLKNKIKQLRELVGEDGLPIFDIHKGDLENWIDLMLSFDEKLSGGGGSSKDEGFDAFLKKRNELRTQLKKTKEEIEDVKKLLKNGFKVEEAENDAKSYLEKLKTQAQDLENALEQTKYSMSDIDNFLNSMGERSENSGKSKFDLDFSKIEKERQEKLQLLQEAEKAGKIKDKGQKENYEKLINEEAEASEAAMANMALTKSFEVADKLTNAICNAIKKGAVDGVEAAKLATEGLDFVGDILVQTGDPEAMIAGMVLKSISQVMKITMKIIDAAESKATEEFQSKINSIVESTKQTADEAAQEIVDNIEKSIEEKTNAPMTTAAQSILNAITSGFQQGNFSNFKKTIDDILKKMIVEKMLLFTGLQDKIQNLVSKMFEKAPESGKQQINKLKEQREALLKEQKEYEKEAAAYYAFQKEFDKVTAEKRKGWHNRDKGYKVTTGKLSKWQEDLKTQMNTFYFSVVKYETLANKISEVDKKIKEINPNQEVDVSQIQEIDENELNATVEEEANKIKEVFKKMGWDIGDDFKNAFIEGATSALTTAMGEAAYNADWGAFKKSFASEMKKAIIQTAIESAGIKKKVDEIINAVMDDGKITTEEITGAINKLQPIYDKLEEMMAEAASVTKSLEGGVEIRSETKGHIIQQLSGADRDVLVEEIRNGFKTINQTIDLKDATIQHLAATQIIINAVTLNSYNGAVYIQATENTDLKGLIKEITQEVLSA